MPFLRDIGPKIIRYRLARRGLWNPGKPFNLTFSVTNLCQSRCRTCKIWRLYEIHPEKRREELTIEEIENIFRTMGHIYIFNVSGGEPFIRPDFVDIIRLACRHLTPGIIHIPTNAIAANRIENMIVEILDVIRSHHPAIKLTVKPSLDHIGIKHDDIRGVPGNFEKVMRLFRRLQRMQQEYPNLHVELGTVISRWNVEEIEEIARFVTELGVDSYRNEIAEQRSEMFNLEDGITPDAAQYEKAVGYFVRQIRSRMKSRLFFHRATQAFRLVYYDLAIQALNQSEQIIPCYAGLSNAHMSPYGDIWPCCTLGYEKTMGNLRDYHYHFHQLWNSPQAMAVRDFIKKGSCACPLANQAYSNILLHGPSLMRVLYEMARSN